MKPHHTLLIIAALELFGLPFRWGEGSILGVVNNLSVAVAALWLAKLAWSDRRA